MSHPHCPYCAQPIKILDARPVPIKGYVGKKAVVFYCSNTNCQKAIPAQLEAAVISELIAKEISSRLNDTLVNLKESLGKRLDKISL